MRHLVTNDRKRVGAWVAEKVGRSEAWTTAAALGLEKDGELVAGIVLDGYTPKARASMHCAIEKKGMNKEFLYACFDYAFRFLDIKVLLNPVSAKNEASLRFTKHIGFKEVGRFPQAWDGEEDLVLFSMQRDECRWLGA